MTVYLNGQFLPLEDAKISVLDRGFIYAVADVRGSMANRSKMGF